MKQYFNIDVNIRHHKMEELDTGSFKKKLNISEKFGVLSEQLREIGLQPHMYMDGSGFEILEATKKFMEGRKKPTPSNRQKEYMNYIDNKEEFIKDIIFNKSGSGSMCPKISLPIKWVNDLGLNTESKKVKLSFCDGKIIIEKTN